MKSKTHWMLTTVILLTLVGCSATTSPSTSTFIPPTITPWPPTLTPALTVTPAPPTDTPAPPPATPAPISPPPTPQSATHTVCAAGCDFTTLQAAINSPHTPAGAVIKIADPVHTEAGILINKNVTIQGRGAGSSIVQAYPERTGATARVFHVAPGIRATLREITIRHGYPSSSPYAGGGIWNEGALTLISSIVSHNRAADGGGIWNQGTLTITHSTLTGNYSDGAGDPYVQCGSGAAINNGDSAILTLIGSAVTDNQAKDKAGGIHVACYGVVTLIGCTVTNNKAAGKGGGFHVGPNGLLRLIDSTVQNNVTGDKGGGVYIKGTLEYTNTVIGGCVLGGAGGYRGQGAVRVQNNTRVEDNYCPWIPSQ